MQNSKVFQPKFIRKELSLGSKIWRAFLLCGLNVYIVGLFLAVIETHWSDAWQRLVIMCIYYLVIQYERTLDRWEDWVPPIVRGRRP